MYRPAPVCRAVRGRLTRAPLLKHLHLAASMTGSARPSAHVSFARAAAPRRVGEGGSDAGVDFCSASVRRCHRTPLTGSLRAPVALAVHARKVHSPAGGENANWTTQSVAGSHSPSPPAACASSSYSPSSSSRPSAGASGGSMIVVRKESMKMARAHKSWDSRVRDNFRRTRERLPKMDDDSLVLCFSQGTTDYCWKPVPHHPNIREPSVLRGETTYNRVRLFGMPKGYPDTTAAGFQRFFYLSQASSFVSNFSSSIGFQSLLNGFFVGSSPQLWMLKDLVPALLAAYLANKVVSYENRPKFWFSVSVFMNNAAVISDMLIPTVLPAHLLAAAIVTSTVKQSSALMFFVTRAAALQHFATHNNLAELTKKFNSFGMVNYTIATALGIVYCVYVASFPVQLVTAVVCCALNMVLAPMSMNPIGFRILNFTTMEVVMAEYVRSKRVLSPGEVSDILGVRMVPPPVLDRKDRRDIIYVSPPIDKLIVRSHTLDEDVLYVQSNGMFMIGMWEPSPVPLTVRECWLRWEMPRALQLANRWASFRRTVGKAAPKKIAEAVFGGKRLVLLVHNKCSPRDLFTAYLVMYTATMRHATTELQLREFVRQCSKEQVRWQAEAVQLRDSLRLVNWDVELMSIDQPNFRLSELFVPPSMRPDASAAS